MKFACGLLLVLAVVSRADGRSASGSPVERVVELLKTLQKSIEDDGEREMQLYNKYTCWTDKVLKLKANAIDEAKAKAKATARSILTLKGTVATLASEIQEYQNKIAESKKLQEEATAVRQKENAAFFAETSETKEAILAMEKAITVLSAGTSAKPSLLQTRAAQVAAVRTALQALPDRSSVAFKPEKMSLLTAFMKDGSAANYAPQSVTVQGILRDMYDTFTGDLESATQDEATSNRNYEKLMFEMQKNVKQWQDDVADKQEKKADAEGKLADATQLYDELQAQIKADIAFFDEVQANGLAKHGEWTERKNLRDAELEGISKALDILSSDKARTLFESSIKPGKATPEAGSSLLQLAGGDADAATAALGLAYNVLKVQAQASGSVRLGQLAVEVRLAKVGHFDKVIASIDSMVIALKEEDADDIKKRDQCKGEYQSLASSISDLNWKIKVNSAEIRDLEQSMEKNSAERDQTIADIKSVNQQMSDMTAVRKEENGAFLQAKKEDEGAIHLLKAATEVFSKYYGKNNITMGPIQGGVKDLALAQAGPDFEISQWQAPEANFKDTGHHKNEAKGIVSILTMITEDLADEVRVAQKEEADSQTRYEAATKAAEQLRSDLIDRKITLENMIATDQKSKADENRKKDNNEAEVKSDETYKASITKDCDWIIGAFAERAKKRAAEMEGLSGAKDFLAGAEQAALVQKKSSFLRKSA